MNKLINSIFITILISFSALSSEKELIALDIYQPKTKYDQNTIDEYYSCKNNSIIRYNENKYTLDTLKYFGTTIAIDIFDIPDKHAEKILCNALTVIQEYHYLASNYSTYPHVKNIKSINEAPEKIHKIDFELFELIAESIEWHKKSNGYFNIALSPVIDLWREKRSTCLKANNSPESCSIPSDLALHQAASFTQINDIVLNSKNHTIQMKKGMKIDLGGIAKGWMTEKVYDLLKKSGVKQFMINAGGNIRHFGLHPEKRQFVTAIEDPLCKKSEYQLTKCATFEGMYHEVVSGIDITIVSSGNYLRFFEVNSKQYHHLIDPHTNAPKPTGIATTVILTDQQIYADVLSTMLFLMPLKEAIEFVDAHDYIEAVWYLNDDGKKVTSAHFNKHKLSVD